LRLASDHPAELARFHAETVGAIADYDAEHGTAILETLVAYLDNDCNMNATATAIFAHRHTIAYRLERVHELTGLDPLRREGRERLGLGLKTAALLDRVA
jgi:PucR family transcriptional regulator, purine catabolism regulatory protein